MKNSIKGPKWHHYGLSGNRLSRISKEVKTLPKQAKKHPKLNLYITKKGEIYVPVKKDAETVYLFFDKECYAKHKGRGDVLTYRVSLPDATVGVHKAMAETYIKYPILGNEMVSARNGSLLDLNLSNLYCEYRFQPVKLKCKKCGKEYESNSYAKLYCNECFSKIKKQRKDESFRKKHPIDNPYILLYIKAMGMSEHEYEKGEIDPKEIKKLLNKDNFTKQELDVLLKRGNRISHIAIAKEYGVTKQRIQQIEKKALNKLEDLIFDSMIGFVGVEEE